MDVIIFNKDCFMSKVSLLASNIAKALQIKTHDIEPVYLPNMKEIRDLSNISLSILKTKIKELRELPEALNPTKQARKGLSNVLNNELVPLFRFIEKNIDEYGLWSFYHYLGLVTVVNFHYSAAIKQNKHNTINLSLDETWNDSPSIDVPVLSLGFISGQLYRQPLVKFTEYFDKNNITMSERCEYIKQQIRAITG
jgi:hypothetical protein